VTALERMRELIGKATPGKWRAGLSCAIEEDVPHGDATVSNSRIIIRSVENRDDIPLIAFLRNHAEALADVVETLEQLANNNLDDSNCLSVEVAAKRVRNVARAALAKLED